MKDNSTLKYIFLIVTLLLAFMADPLLAQVNAEALVKASGVVKDEQGMTLPGATVKVLETGKTFATDVNGRFSILIPKGASLQFSFVTMRPRQLKFQTNQDVAVVLKAYDVSLGEVVVTGYNRTTTRRTTGSIGSIKPEDIKGKPLESLDKLIQGKIAGVSVSSISGRPGEAAKIRIRGTNTITGNSDPLWVVDGVPLQKDIPNISTRQVKAGDFNSIFSGGIAGINPNDIASVTVLKDASAAAIYGSRAAGGVIVVTTKRGEAGKTKVNYATNWSVGMKPERSANLMNSEEKLAWEQKLWDEFSAEGFRSDSYYPVIGLTGMVRSGKGEFAGMTVQEKDAYLKQASTVSTDWFDVLFRNSVSQSHYLSFSGGSDKSTHYLSMGYSSNNGLVKHTSYDRYNVNAKLSMTPHRKLSLGFIADMAYQASNSPSTSQNPFKYAYFANPYEKLYNEDGSYRPDGTYFNLKQVNGGGYDVFTPPNGINIMREINETSNVGKNFSGTVTLDLNYRISDDFKLVGLGSYSYTDNRSDNINGRYTNAAWRDRLYFETTGSTRAYGSITQASTNNSSYMLRGQLQFDKELSSKHAISALAGSEIRRQEAKSIFEKRYGYDEVTGNSSIPIPPKPIGSEHVDYNDLISYAAMVDGLSGQTFVEDAFVSFYASADYAFNKKYVASATARTDGSNNFGSNQQFNPTWSLGAAWNIDQEPFFKSLLPVFSSMMIRLATGYTGNVNKSVFPQLVMDYSTSFRKTFDDYFRMGEIRNAPNKNLRWEKTRDLKASVDFGLFKSRITGSLEAYTRTSKDLVTRLRVPSTTGFTTQAFNTSETVNEGLELSLSWLNIKTTDFSWRTSLNGAYNRNTLTKYATSTGTGNPSSGNVVNYPISSIFGGRISGIDAATGIYKYVLRPDAIVSSNADLRNADNYLFYLGTSVAPFTGGFSTSATYKKFSLSIGGNYSIGSKILDNIDAPVSYMSLQSSSSSQKETIPTQYNDLYLGHLNNTRDRIDYWSPENPIVNAYPRLIDYYGSPLGLYLDNPTASTITQASMLANVSYLRIGSLMFSYSLAGQYLKKLHLESLGLSLSMSNLLTITNYKGIDPETPGAVYPLTRSVSFGINIGF